MSRRTNEDKYDKIIGYSADLRNLFSGRPNIPEVNLFPIFWDANWFFLKININLQHIAQFSKDNQKNN